MTGAKPKSPLAIVDLFYSLLYILSRKKLSFFFNNLLWPPVWVKCPAAFWNGAFSKCEILPSLLALPFREPDRIHLRDEQTWGKEWLKMRRYSNHQANGRTGSCLQGGVAFLWLPDKPPAPGIKQPPRDEALAAATVTRTYLQTCNQEARIRARKKSSFGISHLYRLLKSDDFAFIH